ncbi:uncharacterized protein LOC121401418 [Xenopus laevis]|uniref:Uncharacterized protein LOC121394640 n=1 Tax=Xenopus laevis TaxID=8355 RepID=A0A8J1MKN9_XENLA|nr:uncharacterized protein LOC121394640 [Xenopus laevis]XP_041441971.1 uncharacterized protein LOC121401418 [Xenopus laevis]
MPSDKFLKPDFLREFIELYQTLPSLWKVKSDDYSNRNKREKAYEQLVTLCRTVCPTADVPFVKSKISNLRTVFRKELNKVQASKKSGASADDIYVPKLWYFDLLLFTVDQEVARYSNSNLSSVENHNETYVDVEAPATQTTESTESTETSTETQSQTSVNTSSLDSTQQASTTEVSHTPNRPNLGEKGKKRKRLQTDDNTQKLITDAASLLSKRTDEHDAFAFTVASKLRRMEEEQRLFAENMITQVLQKGLMKKLSDYTTINDHNPTSIQYPQPSWYSPAHSFYPPVANSSQYPPTPHESTQYENL